MIELMIIWTLLTLGLVYLVTKAHVFRYPRYWLAVRSNLLAGLLSCRWCSGFWSGAGAFAYLVLVSGFPVMWYAQVPVAGVCGIGLVEMIYRLSPEAAVEQIAELIDVKENTDG